MSAVGVLDKVVAILDSFGDGAEQQEPAQVAGALGMSSGTTYRLMAAMSEHRLLEVRGRSYRLGSKLVELAARAHPASGVVTVAGSHLAPLRDRTGESVEVHLLEGHRRIPVDMRISSRTVRAMSQLGVPLPIHVGASGRVLLLDRSDDEALALARASAAEFGGDWDEEVFLERLRAARSEELAYSAGERDPETAGVAAAVRDSTGGLVAALVASSTATRMADEAHRAAIVAELRATAARISEELGFRPAVPHRTAPTTTKEYSG